MGELIAVSSFHFSRGIPVCQLYKTKTPLPLDFTASEISTWLTLNIAIMELEYITVILSTVHAMLTIVLLLHFYLLHFPF